MGKYSGDFEAVAESVVFLHYFEDLPDPKQRAKERLIYRFGCADFGAIGLGFCGRSLFLRSAPRNRQP